MVVHENCIQKLVALEPDVLGARSELGQMS